MSTQIIKFLKVLNNGKKLSNVQKLMARNLVHGSSSYSHTLDKLRTAEGTASTAALTGKRKGLRLQSCLSAIPIVGYDDIKNLGQSPDVVLIDVREPNELHETGCIPRSINIPLGEVAKELSPDGDASKFKTKFGIQKPGTTTALIFHCKAGIRSQNAAEFAKALGYTNVKNYKGSWDDWANREGLPK